MRRLDTPELLDEPNPPRADVDRSLRDLRRFNRYLGGISIYKRLLRRFGTVSSVLDIGAGSAELVSSLDGDVTRIALDIKLDHLLYLRDDRTLRVVGDAMRLPFRTQALDVVTSAHFFHHFSADENVIVLNGALRVARRGVVVNDTRRHLVPLLFVKLLAWMHLVGRITRFDAPASIRRGYTTSEAHAIGERVGAKRIEVRKAWPFRFGLFLWK